MAPTDIDRNLLFGVLALQRDMIDQPRFAEACSVWALATGRPLADVLIERGWITKEDRSDIERDIERKLRKHRGDVRATLGDVAGPDARDAIRAVDQPEVRKTLSGLPPARGHVLIETIAPPNRHEGSRYTLTRLHAEGGLGKVWVARDGDLNREVALKEIRPEGGAHAENWRRFLKEAQITGQLEHPNIVPVYELARRKEDDQPFYTMRFVRGRTLRAAIAEFHRNGGSADRMELQKLLAAFINICQAVGYAHSRGVIHRDLKPENVMMGGFGEVIVLDWGLAKMVDEPEQDDEVGKAPRLSVSEEADLVRTLGQVGTPAYMAPEQVEARNDLIDSLTDVYALGGILFEILTGRPPAEGDTTAEVFGKIVAGTIPRPRDLVQSVPRPLDAICARAVARDRAGRYAKATDLAEDVRRWVADEPVSAWREPFAERARRWAKRNRTAVTAAAAALLAVMAVGGGGYVWNQQQKAVRVAKTARAVDDALVDAARFRGEALFAPPGDATRWSEALSAAMRAQGLLAQGEAEAPLKARVNALLARIKDEQATATEKARQIEVDRVLLTDLESVRGSRSAHFDLKRADAEYAAVFRKAGLDLDMTGAKEAGKWLASRTDPVEMAGYLDDWAFVRRGAGRAEANWRRLVAVAMGGDPDPWRDTIRVKFGSDDAEGVAEFRLMADDPRLLDQPAAGLLLLARQLKFGCGDGNRAAQVLRLASHRHPGDFRVHFELALAPGAPMEAYPSTDLQFPYPEEAVRHLSSALAIRPGSNSTHILLGIALIANRKPGEAEVELREAVRLKPNDPSAHAILGNALRWQLRLTEAEAELREAVRLKPDDARNRSILGLVLYHQGILDDAATEFREALRLKPDFVDAALTLASVLQKMGDYAGALATVRKLKEQVAGPIATIGNGIETLAKVEPLAVLAGRLPAILKGEDHPRDIAERLDLGRICYNKRLYAASARFWGEALEADPKLANDRRTRHRYNTACAAILAGSGQGKDVPAVDAVAKAKLRERAHALLQAELAVWSKLVESGPAAVRPSIAQTLKHWREDSDLAGIREQKALEALPETEREPWRALWAGVDALLAKAENVTTPAGEK